MGVSTSRSWNMCLVKKIDQKIKVILGWHEPGYPSLLLRKCILPQSIRCVDNFGNGFRVGAVEIDMGSQFSQSKKTPCFLSGTLVATWFCSQTYVDQHPKQDLFVILEMFTKSPGTWSTDPPGAVDFLFAVHKGSPLTELVLMIPLD